jgi:hypothetical protein
MSIRIAANTNGQHSVPGTALDGSAKPMTFCFWAKVDTLPTTSTNNVAVIKSTGGTGYIAARVIQSSAIRGVSATSNNGTANASATHDLAANMAGAWRCCVAVFTSNTLRDVYTALNSDAGGLLTTTNTTSNVSSGETGIELLVGLWPTSAARYEYLTVYNQALTPAQADEYRLTGAVAGLTPLHRWDTTSDWGAGTIADTGSNPIALTPPGTWEWDADNPTFSSGGSNTAPEVDVDQLSEFQWQVNATDADDDPLTYTIQTQGAFGVATVSSWGLVTYVQGDSFTGDDSFVVRVSDGAGGNTDTTINIVDATVGQPTGTWLEHRPSGMAILEPRNFASLTETGWYTNESPRLDLVAANTTDVTTPFNFNVSGNVLRYIYPVGFEDGFAASSSGISVSDSPIWQSGVGRYLYACIEVAFSENWLDHPTGTNKIGFIYSEGYGGGGDPLYIEYDSDVSPPRIKMVNQGPGTVTSLTPNLADVRIPNGKPVLIEVLAACNTAGNSNGEVHMWINGIKTTEYTGLPLVNAGGYVFNAFKIEPTWGGNVADLVISEEQYFYCSRTAVAVSNSIEYAPEADGEIKVAREFLKSIARSIFKYR